MPAHRGKLRHGRLEPGDDRRFGRAAILFALVLVDDLDHPFEREDAVEPRLGGIQPPGEGIDGREHSRQHRFVDAHDGSNALALDGECAIDRAAREHLAALLRAGTSTASQPGGRRSRRSSPLALTDLSSQAQAIGCR